MTKTTDSNTANTTTANPTSSASSTAKSPWDMPWALPVPEAFSQLMRDSIARTHAMMSELANHEGVAVERARTAVAELSRLANDSITYVGQLSNEWRKLSIEAVQRATSALTPKA
jgi:hypothetical protein